MFYYTAVYARNNLTLISENMGKRLSSLCGHFSCCDPVNNGDKDRVAVHHQQQHHQQQQYRKSCGREKFSIDLLLNVNECTTFAL